MGFFKKLDDHTSLIATMAETVHADFPEALQSGRMSGQDLRNAVMACMGCEGSCDCKPWLEAHSEGAQSAPDFCRNRAMLDRIKH